MVIFILQDIFHSCFVGQGTYCRTFHSHFVGQGSSCRAFYSHFVEQGTYCRTFHFRFDLSRFTLQDISLTSYWTEFLLQDISFCFWSGKVHAVGHFLFIFCSTGFTHILLDGRPTARQFSVLLVCQGLCCRTFHSHFVEQDTCCRTVHFPCGLSRFMLQDISLTFRWTGDLPQDSSLSLWFVKVYAAGPFISLSAGQVST